MYKIILFIFLSFGFFTTFATQNDLLIGETSTGSSSGSGIIEETFDEELLMRIIENYEIEYKENIYISNDSLIDITDLQNNLEERFEDKDFSFEWVVSGYQNIKGEKFSRVFDTKGEKEIILNIYYTDITEGSGKNILLYSKNINIFVYNSTISLLISDETGDVEENDFRELAKKNGVYIYDIIGGSDLDNINLLDQIKQYNTLEGDLSDYLIIWGDKDFILDMISKINVESEGKQDKNTYNLVLLSAFNINILDSYLKNFLANKKWINDIILTPESSKFLIFDNPTSIISFGQQLALSSYDYKNIDTQTYAIDKWLFVSNFVNFLSNRGYNTSGIYILLLLPFLLLCLSFLKHMVGLSTLGIIIPIVVIIIMFKLGLILGLVLTALYFIFNLILAKLVSRYTLLYTPKISFLITLNIIFLIFVLNIIYHFGLFPVNIYDSLYFIMFILMTERLISIIISKEFLEYKKNILNTFVISILLYFLFSFNFVEIFILSYPEIIILLIPLDFLIGKFTGLRVTEYFRFREVIKNIEE